MNFKPFCKLAAVAAPVMLFSSFAVADEDDEQDETVVVIGDKSPTPLSQTGTSVSVLDEQAIVESQEVAIFDLLRTLPGVSVSRNGGIGTVSTLRLRGAESGQTLVLIDGIKVNDLSAPAGEFNFANLLTDNIERIEVLRGPQSTLYGGDAIGGVINIMTKKADAPVSLSGSLEAGSFGTVRGSANLGYSHDILSLSLSASGMRTGGISAADSANGNTESDPFKSYVVSGNMTVRLSDHVSVDGLLRYADSTSHFDAFDFIAGTFVDGDGVTMTQDLQGSVGLNFKAFGGALATNARVSWSSIERFDSENGGPSFASASENRTVDLLNTIAVSDALRLLIGGQFQNNRITTEVFGAFASMLAGEADTNSVFGEAILVPVKNLRLTAGVRHDDHETFGGATTFRLTGNFRIPETGTVLRANWGQGFKPPTLFQLFSAFGDPALRPEESEGWEIGFAQDIIKDHATLQVTYFRRNSKNQIDFSLLSFTFANIVRTRAKGIEVLLAARLNDDVAFEGNYTRLDATDVTTGLPLVRRPRNVFNGLFKADVSAQLKVSASVNYTGRQLDGGVMLDAFTLIGLRASFEVAKNITLFGRIENAFNENYQEVSGFGTAGIAGFAGVRGNF